MSECRSAGSLIGTKVSRLTTCSGASDDSINIRPGQGPSSYDNLRGRMRH
jgi:hypothetical protein